MCNDQIENKKTSAIERKIISSLNVNSKVYNYLEKKDLINNIEELKNFSRFLITNDQKLLSQTKDILIDLERIIQLLNKSKIKNKDL